jgi:arylsulfatase A-like enzyme
VSGAVTPNGTGTREPVPAWRWAAPPVVLLAALVGLAVGCAVGWHYLQAGYPLLFLRALADELMLAFEGALVFLLVFLVLERLTGRWLSRSPRPWGRMVLFALIAAVPLVAATGLRLNRALGIRPADLATSRGLTPNLLLVVAAVALVLVGVAWLRRIPAGGADREWRWVAAALLVAVLSLAGSRLALSAAEAKGERPDVLVILIDALRADHLSGSGYGRPTTPALDALAADGVRFTQAVASSTFTKTSIASLFTGRHPYQHGVYWGSLTRDDGTVTADVLSGKETTLAETMRDQGYLTAAWVQNSHLQEVMGFGQGFVDYHDNQGDIERIHRGFRRFLDGPGRRYPFFAYLHYIDLHDPYLPEPPYDTMFTDGTAAAGDAYEGIDLSEWGKYLQAVRAGDEVPSAAELERLRALYDGQLRHVDDQVGEMLEDLKRRGLYDDTLIVVTADHGDAFYEHGFISHSTAPYEELVRVPLLVKLPRGRFGGAEVTRQVRLIDVYPTVVAAVGGTLERDAVAGCSLQSLIRQAARGGAAHADDGDDGDDPWDPACGLAVTEIAEGDPESPPTLGLRVGGMKYIRFADPERRPELYDLKSDAGEKSDLAGSRPDDVTRLGALVRRFDELREKEREDQVELDAATIRELKALGYL